MPRTVSASFVPLAETTWNPEPIFSACSFAQPSSTIAPVAPSEPGTASSPLAQSNENTFDSVRGSMPLTYSTWPNALPPSWVMPLTARTPGTAAASVTTLWSTGDQPSEPTITWSADTRRSSDVLVVSFRPPATTVTRVTSATPIV